MNRYAVNLDQIQEARSRISRKISHTPVVELDQLSKKLNFDLRLKAENLQRGGSFKLRGATNAILSLTGSLGSRGVIAHSSGNHAAALASAATANDIKATIVMPRDTSERKINAVMAYGVSPVLCEPSSRAREQATQEIIDQTHAHLIHAYDDPDVIAGQGTVGLEILEQVKDADSILAPIGGGGLLAGILVAAKTLNPKIRVWGCEPTNADDAFRSLETGAIQNPTRYDTVADGLRTAVGKITFPIIQSLVDGILLVDEEEIIQATRQMVLEARLVAEPSGAVTLAAANRYANQFHGQTVVAVVSGGNLDMSHCKLGHS